MGLNIKIEKIEKYAYESGDGGGGGDPPSP
jgi:hypothetical protein